MSLSSSTTPPPGVDPLSLLPKVPSLDDTFGSFLIATFIGLILYGLILHQTYRYFRLFPGDAPVVKFIVGLTLLLETGHVALITHICYYYLVANYFEPTALLEGVWSIRILPVFTAAIILVSQGFFTRRVYLIGGQYRIVVAIVPVLMLASLGFAIATTVEAYLLPSFAQFRDVAWAHRHRATAQWMTSAAFGIAVVVETLLTGTLILVLQRSRTGFRRTDSLIDLLIIYAINTGLLTGIFSFLSFIFAIVAPGNLIYAGFNLLATKLYANSLLAVLNSRKALLAQQDCFGTAAGTYELSGLRRYDEERAAKGRWNVPLDRSQGLPSASAATKTTTTVIEGTVLDTSARTEATYAMDVESLDTAPGSRL
ncbi:hypothetical protein C8Q77DRAFT_621556 [Trametes polyzona]|nr:hypothetical protein C8Q77DRAFT_621556 [Trametes polyzona]